MSQAVSTMYMIMVYPLIKAELALHIYIYKDQEEEEINEFRII